jgi:hypothetical protein
MAANEPQLRPLSAARSALVIFGGPLALLGGSVVGARGSARALRAGARPRARHIAMLAVAAAYGAALPRLRVWGTTADERGKPLAGDETAPRTSIQHTRAVTIDAPPDQVWPWLIQAGPDRAGFYSYRWLENLAGCRMPKVEEINPGWQQREVGDTVFLHHEAGLKVVAVDPGRSLTLEAGWSFVLEPAGPGASRLLARWRFPPGPLGLLFALLMDLPHHLMERKMLLGIKRRAEAARR